MVHYYRLLDKKNNNNWLSVSTVLRHILRFFLIVLSVSFFLICSTFQDNVRYQFPLVCFAILYYFILLSVSYPTSCIYVIPCNDITLLCIYCTYLKKKNYFFLCLKVTFAATVHTMLKLFYLFLKGTFSKLVRRPSRYTLPINSKACNYVN